MENLLQIMPLWLAGLLLVVLCLLAAEVGRYVGKQFAPGSGARATRASSEAENYIMGAIFGLLAFMISLTFAIAVERFDGRRGWVAEEANAIQFAYLQATYFDEPDRSKLLTTIRSYAQSRIAPDGVSYGDLQRQQQYSGKLRDRLVSQTRASVYPVRDSEYGENLLSAVNDAIQAGNRRVWAGTTYIPSRILNGLTIYLLVASAALGYLSDAKSRRQRLASGLLFVLFAIALVMILDLDRPRAGWIKVSQQPLIDVISTLHPS